MMTKLVRPLIIFQLLGVCLAAVAAMMEIESIVISGPLLTLLGVLLAIVCYRQQFALGYYFGLSVPTISLICFALIYGFSWGPGQAKVPIRTAIFLFGLGSFPLAIAAVWRFNGHTPNRLHRPPQFHLSTLLGLVLVVSLPLALYRFGPPATAIGLLFTYGLLLCHVLNRFHRRVVATGARCVAT